MKIFGIEFFILLWLYAALLKLYDVSEFGLQMQESPLLPKKWIPFLAYCIPLSEIGLAVCLFLEPSKIVLYANFVLISLFTVYLVLLKLFFSKNLPCACGGIFGYLPYKWHIFINLCFCGFAFWLIQ